MVKFAAAAASALLMASKVAALDPIVVKVRLVPSISQDHSPLSTCYGH